MLAWARRWPVAAGILFGLAVAAKFYPLLILGALFLLCLRAGRLRAWTRTAVAATLAWLVVDVPVAVLAPDNWAWFFVFSRQRPANPETVWNILIYASGGRAFDGPLAPGESPTVLNTVVTVLLVAFGLLVAWLVFRAPVRPRVAQVSFLLVAGFLELNKVWSPQYSLWLLPLAVLARPRWRSLLLWQLSEALVWMMTMLNYLGTANRGIGVQWFYASALLRDLVVLALMALVVRDVLQPDQDVVRTSWPGIDDPAGGVLDGAETDLGALEQPPSAERGSEQLDLLVMAGAGGLEDDGGVGGAGDLEQQVDRDLAATVGRRAGRGPIRPGRGCCSGARDRSAR